MNDSLSIFRCFYYVLFALLLYSFPFIVKAECKLFTTTNTTVTNSVNASNSSSISHSKSAINNFSPKASPEKQTIRTIQLGAFAKPDLAKYAKLLDIGCIHAERSPKDNLVRVRLGMFGNWKTANDALQKVKKKGYPKATITRFWEPLEDDHYFVQLGAFKLKDGIPWKHFSKIKNLYLIPDKNHIKVGVSVWGSRQDAQSVLQQLNDLGYQDGYIRTLNHEHLAKKKAANKKAMSAIEKSLLTRQSSKPSPKTSTKSSDLQLLSNVQTSTKSNSTKQSKPATYSTSSNAINESKNTSLNYSNGTVYRKRRDNIPIKNNYSKITLDELVRNRPNYSIHSPMYVRYKTIPRQSMREFQEFLMKKEQYEGTLDGLWGDGTNRAVQQLRRANKTYSSYKGAVNKTKKARQEKDFTNKKIQEYVNLIGINPIAAADGLMRSNHPAAKMYLAYLYLNGDVPAINPEQKVSDLMFSAINQVFRGAKVGKKTALDKETPKYYNSLSDFIHDMRFLHEEVDVKVPSWFIKRHKNTYLKHFGSYWKTGRDLVQTTNDCDGFMHMNEIALLSLIAQDMNKVNLRHKYGKEVLSSFNDNKNNRILLYLSPNALSKDEITTYEQEHEKLWRALDKWANVDGEYLEDTDRKRQRMTKRRHRYTALKLAYYAAFFRLEDFFFDKGFDAKQARGLALKAIPAILNFSLEEYLKYDES